MSKLIFNPEKDMKELLDYGFKVVTIVDKIKYQYVEMIGKQEIYNVKVDENGIVHYNQYSVYNEVPIVIYKCIKANLFIDEEDLKNGFMDKKSR